MTKRLVLVGGGHAHLSVLRALAKQRPAGIDVVLITPSKHQNYSGMLPGWVAGHCTQTKCRIDLEPLIFSVLRFALCAGKTGLAGTLSGSVHTIRTGRPPICWRTFHELVQTSGQLVRRRITAD